MSPEEPNAAVYRCRYCGLEVPREANARGMANRQNPCDESPGNHSWRLKLPSDRPEDGGEYE